MSKLVLVDALALLGKATADMNQFRRNNLRSRLPSRLRPLATIVPPESQWLFGDDLNKRIAAQISRMNNTLSQSFKSNNQQNRYNHSSVSIYHQQHQRSKNYQPSRRSSALRKKGQRQSNNRCYKN